MKIENIDQARMVAAGYISPAGQDENVTALATGAAGLDPAGLLVELRRELEAARTGIDYQHEPTAEPELSALVTWAEREYGRYIVQTYVDVYGDEQSYLHVFERLTDVSAFLRNAGFTLVSETAPYLLRTWVSRINSDSADMSAHAESGFTDRTWSAVVRSVVG